MFIFALALNWVESAFSKAEGFWRNLEQFVIKEKIEALLKGKLGIRSKLDGAVGSTLRWIYGGRVL